MEAKTLRVQFSERREDSCWSWVVCLSSFIVQFLILGTHNSFGSFFVALLQEFQRSEAETGKQISHYFSRKLAGLLLKNLLRWQVIEKKTLANFVATRNVRPVFVTVKILARSEKIEVNQSQENFKPAFHRWKKKIRVYIYLLKECWWIRPEKIGRTVVNNSWKFQTDWQCR